MRIVYFSFRPERPWEIRRMRCIICVTVRCSGKIVRDPDPSFGIVKPRIRRCGTLGMVCPSMVTVGSGIVSVFFLDSRLRSVSKADFSGAHWRPQARRQGLRNRGGRGGGRPPNIFAQGAGPPHFSTAYSEIKFFTKPIVKCSNWRLCGPMLSKSLSLRALRVSPQAPEALALRTAA